MGIVNILPIFILWIGLIIVGELFVKNRDLRIFMGVKVTDFDTKDQIDSANNISNFLIILGRLLQLYAALNILLSIIILIQKLF